MNSKFWLQFGLMTAQNALSIYLMEADPAIAPQVMKLSTDVNSLLTVLNAPAAAAPVVPVLPGVPVAG